jgi:hypothetical protein
MAILNTPKLRSFLASIQAYLSSVGITIGTTAVTGGSSSNVLFINNGVVSQASSLTYNSSNLVTSVYQLAVSGGQYMTVDQIFATTSGNSGLYMSGAATFKTRGSSNVGMKIQGAASQTAVLCGLQQLSSTSAAQDVAYIDAGFTVNTNASYQGYGRLCGQDYGATAGGREVYRWGANGSAPVHAWFGATVVTQQSGDIGTALVNYGLLTTPNLTGVTVYTHFPVTTTDADGATVTFNLATSDEHVITLGGSRTFAISNATVNQRFTIKVIQAASGGPYTPTWFSTITWFTSTFAAPTMPTTASGAMLCTFKVTGSGTYDGFWCGNSTS